MTALADLLTTAGEAVDLAAALVRSRLPGALTAKGDRDYASEVDYVVERQVREYLKQRTPSLGFLGEEEGRIPGSSDLVWALDPIDGTVNFAHGLPLCAISLALLNDERPVLGVVDLPFMAARYWASEGDGAHRDGQRLHVSRAASLDNAIVTLGDYAVGADAEERNHLRLAVTQQLAGRALRVRMLGSAAIDLAWLAEGKTDASITLSNQPWDTAAGVIIAREAGAQVVDHDGSDHTVSSQSTIAASPTLLPEVLALIETTRQRASQ